MPDVVHHGIARHSDSAPFVKTIVHSREYHKVRAEGCPGHAGIMPIPAPPTFHGLLDLPSPTV